MNVRSAVLRNPTHNIVRCDWLSVKRQIGPLPNSKQRSDWLIKINLSRRKIISVLELIIGFRTLCLNFFELLDVKLRSDFFQNLTRASLDNTKTCPSPNLFITFRWRKKTHVQKI